MNVKGLSHFDDFPLIRIRRIHKVNLQQFTVLVFTQLGLSHFTVKTCFFTFAAHKKYDLRSPFGKSEERYVKVINYKMILKPWGRETQCLLYPEKT